MKIKIYWISFLLILANQAKAQSFVEEFDTIANLWSNGWDYFNHSTDPCQNWHQGSVVNIPYRNSGSFISALYTTTCYQYGTISLWLLTPQITLNNGDEIIFYTISADSLYTNISPDRMQVRLSTNGSSSNVGSSDTAVGDFNLLLLDINPNYSTAGYPAGYPGHWQQYVVTISGLTGPTQGRIAFRYFVESGGNGGGHSEGIGIDSLAYVSIMNVGMNETNGTKVVVYPNPSTDVFRFTSSNTVREIKVKDIFGRFVLSTDKPKINLIDFPDGIYFYEVELDNRELVRGRIIKQ